MRRRYSVATTAMLVAVLAFAPRVAAQAGLLLSGMRTGDPPKSAVPTPRTADGHPDLSGLWIIGAARGTEVDAQGNINADGNRPDGSGANTEREGTLRRRLDPNRPVYKPEFWDKVQYLDDNGNTEDPYFSCAPIGVPRQGPPSKIVWTPNEMIFLYEAPAGGGRNVFRVIPTDGRPHHPVASVDETFMGDSVGHWEGETLVVDVVGFNDTTWLDIRGYFHSTALHVIERLRREGNTLIYEAIADDPKVLMMPWAMTPTTMYLITDPDSMIFEDFPCSERDLSYMVTKEHH